MTTFFLQTKIHNGFEKNSEVAFDKLISKGTSINDVQFLAWPPKIEQECCWSFWLGIILMSFDHTFFLPSHFTQWSRTISEVMFNEFTFNLFDLGSFFLTILPTKMGDGADLKLEARMLLIIMMSFDHFFSSNTLYTTGLKNFLKTFCQRRW